MPPPPLRPIYLTFDDGPTAGYTNEVLADLNAAGAHATFFEIGQSTYTASGMCPKGTPSPSYATCLANASNNRTAIMRWSTNSSRPVMSSARIAGTTRTSPVLS